MIIYHGTTVRRARRIVVDGFRPKRPSKLVWFAQGRRHAERRGRTQTRRARDRAVVLTCELDLAEWRRALGPGSVRHQNRVVAVRGVVPVSALRSWPGFATLPVAPDELAGWINAILRVKPHRGVSPKHPGVQRLSRWVVNRLRQRPDGRVTRRELLHQARRWLPEYFEPVEIEPETLHARRRAATIEVAIEDPAAEPERRREEGLRLLEGATARQRVRGLPRLDRREHRVLFDLALNDPHPEVQRRAERLVRGGRTSSPGVAGDQPRTRRRADSIRDDGQ